MMPTATDFASEQVAELVARAQRGDADADAHLYEADAPRVLRFLRRRFDGPEEQVEDLTADVFVKVFEKLDRYVERGLPFTAWLYRLAYNTLLDYLRVQKGRYTNPIDDATELPEYDTGVAYDRILDRQTLAPVLAQLTPEQRRAVELRFLAGLSVAETSARMGCSDEAVKKLQARALANLRRLLRPSMATSPSAAWAQAC